MKQLLKVCVLLLLMGAPVCSIAQGFEDDEDVVDVPLDGGVSMLAAAGVAYGVKLLRSRKHKANSGANDSL